MEQTNLVWLVLLFPVLGFLIQSLFGRILEKAVGRKVVGALAVLPIAASFLVGALLAGQMMQLDHAERSIIVSGPEWIAVEGFRLPFELRIDPLTMLMVLIITGIGSLIHLYSTAYMAEDRDYTRFFTYMNLFIAAMLILVMGNNLALLFIGWEGVGLCSYLLIGFWYKELPNARAANKAFIVNRVGDWGLMLGLFLIVAALFANGVEIEDGRYLSYDAIAAPLLEILRANPALATTIALLLFVGAAGKSAQFPLYFWLPDAMAGPTPVSALIHAATMVTSGVFLLNRMDYVFMMSPVAGAVICVVGAFTAAFAALIAFGQTDIKRVLAYSTVSQLGFMFIACGAGAYWAGMFHVTTHAFFKALLFLGAGAVIYSMAHNQDMRNYGGLRKYLPVTTWTMVIGFLAIAAFPGLSGFFSKEAILAAAFGSPLPMSGGIHWGMIAGWIGLGVAVLTAIYMARLTMLTFFGKEERWRSIPAHAHAEGHEIEAVAEENPVLDDPNGFYMTPEEVAAQHVHDEHHHELDRNHTPKEAPSSMTIPLMILAVFAAGAGFLMNSGLEGFLNPAPEAMYYTIPDHPEGIPLMALSIAAALIGIGFGVFVYRNGLPKDQGFDEKKWKPWRLWERDQFGYDALVTTGAVEGGGEIGRSINRWFEIGFVDAIVNGVGRLAVYSGAALKLVQTGYVRLYALVMLAGGIGFLGYFLYVMSQIGGMR